MNRKPRTFLIGGDGQNWALDIDLRLTKHALNDVVDFVGDPDQADVIHTINVEQLLIDPFVRSRIREGKPVFAHFTSRPSALFEDYPRLFEECRRWLCVAQTREAYDELVKFKMPHVRRIPYVAETGPFSPLPKDDAGLVALRQELGIPENRYVIGLFQRDSLGADLTRFKPQKGADIFLSIVRAAERRVGKDNIHVLLAGPRRHWLRAGLEKCGISYSFDGTKIEGDDYPRNILPLSRINQLTNLIDLYIIPSRWEGAPHAAFQTIATRKKIISTPLAVPLDLFESKSIFRSIDEAADLISADIQDQVLSATLDPQSASLQKHLPGAVANAWREIYGEFAAHPDRFPKASAPELRLQLAAKLPARALRKAAHRAPGAIKKLTRPFRGKKTLSIWTSETAGVDRIFLKDLGRMAVRHNVAVTMNREGAADAFVLSTGGYDRALAEKSIRSSKSGCAVAQWILPVGDYKDSIAWSNALSNVTLFPSAFAWSKALAEGLDFKQPCILRYASLQHSKAENVLVCQDPLDPVGAGAIEALSQGIPVVALGKGTAHAEAFGFAGIECASQAEIPGAIQRVLDDYPSFSGCAYARPMEETAAIFLEAMRLS